MRQLSQLSARGCPAGAKVAGVHSGARGPAKASPCAWCGTWAPLDIEFLSDGTTLNFPEDEDHFAGCYLFAGPPGRPGYNRRAERCALFENLLV